MRIATERIPGEFGLDPVRQVQILAPQYRGPLGIDALHRRMRDALCGGRAALPGRPLRDRREGDHDAQSLPEHGIANGTLFVIDSDDEANGELMLETDLGELVALPYREARSLRGAFCTSVHKAQGFEIPAVIVCLHSTHAPQLLSRNLLYTAVTRAQRALRPRRRRPRARPRAAQHRGDRPLLAAGRADGGLVPLADVLALDRAALALDDPLGPAAAAAHLRTWSAGTRRRRRSSGSSRPSARSTPPISLSSTAK